MPNFVIDTAVSGSNTIVAAVAGRRIRVTSLALVAAGTVTIQWFDGVTELSGPMSFAVGGGYVLPFGPLGNSGDRPNGYFVTSPGAALNLTLGGAVQVSGHGTYTLEAV